ncbi:MAG TPA: hypothetical protein QF517_00430 [Pseudomonadales bacterium]|jgi:uncharacterized repeat protein (TIGR04076 family)|nr:hypothetical protein [Gammaproteobacteria bacterium]MDP6026117.1 hypothetical protein [Pseudomonadales bacterium]MDP6316089.1 hypothetical protein [Pseudomonadales bacterium]MDP7315559.1 hypothetical protein [Pseudomonadales bacterium]MDP7575668.1 hypothetical protein [Pseudomonadales bacterium]|tara:strand:+ start:8315 stop:8752 length:438 start_codon:yes stop_codon:yes gene_type:complete
MEKEELWKRFQAHMNYTDEEMVLFKSDPAKVKMVTETKSFVKCKIVAEVIEAQGCHAGHRVGDRIVMDGNGQLLTRECPNKVCIFAASALHPSVNVIFERFTSGSDPKHEKSGVVQCSDIGLENGGWGKILMKVFVEEEDQAKTA